MSTPQISVERIVILGSGPAGLTAALYTARAGYSPLVLEGDQPGGQLTITTEVENFPGFPDGIPGAELVDLMRKQACRFGARCVRETATGVDFSTKPFRITSYGSTHLTHAVIIATGARARFLGIESEKRFIGKGVSACAVCDGLFFRNQEVVVVGGGDTACEEALFLTRFAKKVYLVHRRNRLRASKVMQERVFNNKKIEFIWDTVVEDILGEEGKGVTGVLLRNKVNNVVFEKKCEGVFIAIGHLPNTDIFKGQIEIDDKGYVVTRNGAMTNIEGVFAAGDVQDHRYRQAVTAAGSGCIAAIEAIAWLEAMGI